MIADGLNGKDYVSVLVVLGNNSDTWNYCLRSMRRNVQFSYGETIGLGSREYELIQI